MAQTYTLDHVIQKVTSGYKPARNSQKIIIIDVKTKKAIEKKSVWGLGDLRYYLISNNNDVRNVAQGEVASFQVNDLDNNVGISVNYQIRCSPNSEIQVAESLFDLAHSPTEVLERLIKKWVIESCSLDGLPKFIESYFKDRNGLQKTIIDRALKETGLILLVKLSLEAEKSFSSILIEKNHLPVRVKDYDEEQDLKLKAELEVDESNKTNAILHFSKNPDLQHLVPHEVKKFIKQNVSMQSFCTEMNKGPVKQKLIEYLNDMLRPAGRKIGAIILEAKSSQDLQYFFQTEKNVVCLSPIPQPVIIKNKVQMILKDISKYKVDNSPDLDSWLEDKLKRDIVKCCGLESYPSEICIMRPLSVLHQQRLSFERLEGSVYNPSVASMFSAPPMPV